MATRPTGNPRKPAPQSARTSPTTSRNNTSEDNTQYAEQGNGAEDQEDEKFDDNFVSGYDEDYEEDEDLDAATMHNRRETVKSMGGRSRVNKVTDRKEHSVSGERNREQGYRQRAGAATPKARKGATEKK